MNEKDLQESQREQDGVVLLLERIIEQGEIIKALEQERDELRRAMALDPAIKTSTFLVGCAEALEYRGYKMKDKMKARLMRQLAQQLAEVEP